jgi:hypothetical protein
MTEKIATNIICPGEKRKRGKPEDDCRGFPEGNVATKLPPALIWKLIVEVT